MFGAAVTASIHGTGAIDGPVVLAAAALTGVAVGRVLPFNRWRPTWIFGFAVLMVAAAVLRGRDVVQADLNDFEPAAPVQATTIFRAVLYSA